MSYSLRLFSIRLMQELPYLLIITSLMIQAFEGFLFSFLERLLMQLEGLYRVKILRLSSSL